MSNLKRQPQPDVLGSPEIIMPQPFEPATGDVDNTRAGLNPISYAIMALLLLASAVLWYLLSAKSVVITTFPTTKQLLINGSPHLTLADHLLMMPGQYQLTASLPGYYPLKHAFEVTEVQNQQLNFNFIKLPGTLKLAIDPKIPVSVQIDQQPVAVANQTIEPVAAGQRHITVSAPRYFPYQAEITIKGMSQTQSLAIHLIPAWGQVTIDSQPIGAKVFNAGKLLGTTPLYSELLAGEHHLTFEKNGYQKTERAITVVAGTELTINPVTLFKRKGELVVTSLPKGVNVTYGNKYLGTTPLRAAVIPNKTQSLLLFKDGYQRQSHQLKVASGKTLAQTFKLTPITGQVSFKVSPTSALLYINNRLMGRANQTLTLTAKQQNIRIEHDGYVSYNTSLLPNAAMEQLISVTLKTQEQARWENIKPVVTAASGAKLKLFKPNDTFVMGASRREQGRRANEVSRTIELSRPFYLGLTEITNKEFRKFQQNHSSGHVKGYSLNGAEQPAVKVSWLQAAMYCNWLSEQEQLTKVYQIDDGKIASFITEANGYRLPTEAEWAWAVRYIDGKMLKYSWGNSLPPATGAGNFADIAGAPILGNIQNNYNDNFIASAPVASFKENQKGIFDLSGNVAEWIHDYYQIKTGLSLSKEKDPMGSTSGTYHVIRGASWAQGTRTQLRLSFRDYGIEQRNDLGFRIARYAK